MLFILKKRHFLILKTNYATTLIISNTSRAESIMNLILLFPSDFTENQNSVALSGRRFRYIRTFHRAKPGDTVKVGLINGNRGTGRIKEISDNRVTIDVTLTSPPPPPLPVTAIIALPRPKTVKKILHCATALGIKRIFFIRTWRVEKSYWQSPVLKKDSITHECILGLEQAGDTVMPTVEFRELFKPFIEDEIPLLIQNSKAIVFHPKAGKTLTHVKNRKQVTIALGPEGGFIDYEIDQLVQRGFTPVTLGSRIQKVEYVLPYSIGKIFSRY